MTHTLPFHRLVRWTLAFFVLVLSIACSKDKTEPVTLALRLKPGQVYKQLTTSEIKMQLGAYEPKVEVVLKILSGTTQKVEKIDAEGNVTVLVTYDWVDLYGKNLGREQRFDSRTYSPNSSGEAPSALAQLAGKSFEAVLNSRGELLSLSEPSQIFELFEKAGAELLNPGRAVPEIAPLSEEAKKEILQPFPYFPSRAVKVSDHWQEAFKSRHLLFFNATVDLALKHLKGGTAEIEFEINASPAETNPGGEKPKMTMAVSGGGKGKIRLSEATGALLFFEKNESYSGETSQTIPNMAEPLKFPVKIQKSVRVEDQSKEHP